MSAPLTQAEKERIREFKICLYCNFLVWEWQPSILTGIPDDLGTEYVRVHQNCAHPY